MIRSRHLIILSAVFGLAGTHAEPAVPAGFNGNLALEIKPSKTITAVCSYAVSAPDLTAKEWMLFMPKPCNHAGQRILWVTTKPESETIVDLSPLAQPLLRAQVAATREELSKGITCEIRIRAELFSRRLIQVEVGHPIKSPPVLTGSERMLCLRQTPQFNYTNDDFQKWLASNSLKRGHQEGEIDFARRVFLVIARGFQYEYLGEQDRSAGHVCSVKKSDCGGMAVLFATALRSQGIPARTLAGRWAIPAKPGDKIGEIVYHQEHVKAEFFARGVGWVPADLSSAVLHDGSAAKLEYFGNDRGDFLTLHFDNDLSFDTMHFGIRTVSYFQRPVYWVTGSGNVRNATIHEDWTVADDPPVPAK